MQQGSKDRIRNLLFYAVVLFLGYFVFRIFEPFLVPLGWAAVFAVIFSSLNARLEKRWGRKPAASITTIGVGIILVVPLALIATVFVRQGFEAAQSIQANVAAGNYGWIGHAWDGLASHLAAQGIDADLPGLVRKGAERYGEYMASKVGAIVRNIVILVFELFMMLFALFYFLCDGQAVQRRFRLILPFEDGTSERMISQARDLIFASVTTSLVIALVQGVICGGTFALVGLSAAVFWGVLMAFLSLLPVVGAWPVWIPAAIWLFSTGHAWRGLVVIAMCGVFGGMVDNILRPIILGGRSSLNGLMVLISVLGGLAVFGALGIVLGPIVVATAVGMLEVYSEAGESGSAAAAPESS